MDQVDIDETQLLSMMSIHKDASSAYTMEKVANPDIPCLLQAAESLLSRPQIALELGQEINITDYGTFGMALISSHDLNAALKLMLRYQPLLGPGPEWQLISQPGFVQLRMHLNLPDPRKERLVAELVFTHICSVAMYLAGDNSIESINEGGLLTGIELQLAYPKPSHAAAYQDLLAVPVKFNQAHSQLVLSEQILELPVRTANPAGQVVFQQQCEEMLRRLKLADSSTARVRQVLVRSAGEFPNLKRVAAALYISERTLKRRLRDEGTSFRNIEAEVKNLLAQEYLVATGLTVAEIAELLNYTETVNFRRAFVRWNGLTPSQYRLSNALK